MPELDTVATTRRAFLSRLCPDSIPNLWCPLLTHYDKDGAVDEKRILAHLEHVAVFVNGLLVPGTTGDGWQLSEAERLRTLGLVLDQATRLKLYVLVGVLKRDAGSIRACLVGTVEWLKSRTGETNVERCLQRRRIAAFTLCAPSDPQWTMAQIEEELDSLLATGLPLALYELPQVTGRALSPELVRHLVDRHPNLVLFKDSSGTDAIAPYLPPETAVFTVRGAEGDYTRWVRRSQGPYDGLLLSSANCFARELHRLWRDLGRKRFEEAQQMSDRLTGLVRDVFALATEVREGNPFTNANKAIDHYMAFGPQAGQVPPPRLHGGFHLPLGLIRQTGDTLKSYNLMPEKGYLE